MILLPLSTHPISYDLTLPSPLGANVLTIDYRGFGDSGGNPTEEGLGRDARAAWNWLLDEGAKPSDIILMGQSLGTGVAALLAANLELDSTCN